MTYLVKYIEIKPLKVALSEPRTYLWVVTADPEKSKKVLEKRFNKKYGINSKRNLCEYGKNFRDTMLIDKFLI